VAQRPLGPGGSSPPLDGCTDFMPFIGDPRSAPAWFPALIAEPWNDGSTAISRTLKHARTARRIQPSRRMNVTCEELRLQTDDGVGLSGWYIPEPVPSVRSRRICAILHHHYGGQKATVLPWIELFHRLGIATLSFDARGHGASDASPRGRGSFVRRAADVTAACAEARRRGAEGILGFGQSQGAAALVMAMSGRSDLLGCILDSGPAPDMGTAAWGLAGNMLGAAGRGRPWTRALLSTRIVPGTQPVRYLGALWWSLYGLRRVPLLWLHGGRDQVIRRQWAALWYRGLRPEGGLWQCTEVPAAEHVRCLQAGGESVEQDVAAFVAALDGPGNV